MSRSLLEVLRNVTLDPSEHAAFSADPAGYLAQYGYEDVPAEDLAEAFSLVADTLPPDVAQAMSSGVAAEATGAEAGGFGGEAAVADEGFAAGPSLDADPAETTFGAVTNDFDDEAGADLAGDTAGDLDDFDIPAPQSVPQPDDAATGPADDGVGVGFGEGSDALNGAGEAAGLGEGLDDGGLDVDFDDVPEPAGLGLGAIEPGVDETDFGTGEAAEAVDDFGLDDGLDFGSSPDDGASDIDDIGAF